MRELLQGDINSLGRSFADEATDLGAWTTKYRTISGRPFSFTGHEYLRQIYADSHPYIVVRKAAQMGFTEWAVSRSLHAVIHHPMRVLYFFPTDNDVRAFAKDRFTPAMQTDYFMRLMGDSDSQELKQLGQGTIYFRGMRSRSGLKSVPGDMLVFDEVDEMDPVYISLADKRIGHSEFGWKVMLSTPTLPGYGIDAAFLESDQHYWLLHCWDCKRNVCLEDEFVEHHGDPRDPRENIVFVGGEAGAETLICPYCGGILDPTSGHWEARYPSRPTRGYHVTKFLSPIISKQDIQKGFTTRPAALLNEWRNTEHIAEFFNSELGMPYLGAEGGLTEQELMEITGSYRQQSSGTGCVMGVDQGNGLHIVVKEPKGDYLLTLRVHHEPMTNETFSHLDHFMHAFDVRCCVIDAMPNTHSARAFSRRFRGRVYLRWFSKTQKGGAAWGRDQEGDPTVTVNRTEVFDTWRDAHKARPCFRRVPEDDDEIRVWRRQMTNVLRKVEENADGNPTAVWVKRGADHFAHADCYAEIAGERARASKLHVSLAGG